MPHVTDQIRKELTHARKADDEQDGRKIADGLDLSPLEAFSATAFLSTLDDRAIESGEQFLAEIGIPRNNGLFEQVNTRAVQYIRQRGAELVTQIDEATRNGIADIIADSLERNLSVDDIIAELVASYDFSEERAELIARTEIGIANSQGTLAGMRELQAQGVSIKKAWFPDAEACPVCLENADEGFIDIDDTFPSGDDAPLSHPNCECSLISEIEE